MNERRVVIAPNEPHHKMDVENNEPQEFDNFLTTEVSRKMYEGKGVVESESAVRWKCCNFR